MNHRNWLRDLRSQLKTSVTQGNTIIRFNRPLLNLLALGVLLYLLFGWIFLWVSNKPEICWTDNIARIETPIAVTSIVGSPLIYETRPGDVLLAIDGIPYRHSDLQFHYGPPANYHTYEFRRGDLHYTARIESGQRNIRGWIEITIYCLTFFAMWALGSLILLLAPKDESATWPVGLACLGMPIALAGYMMLPVPPVPGAQLAFDSLVPLLAIAYLELAFIPGQANRRYAKLFRLLYGIAGLLSLLALVEIVWLNPSSSCDNIFGLGGLNGFYENFGIFMILVTPAALFLRIWRLPPGPVRQQVGVLLILTSAFIMPVWIYDDTLYLFSIPLMLALPAGYGYIIYRHRYLQLDLLASRSIISLLTILLLSAFYTIGMQWVRQSPALIPLEPIVGLLILLLGFAFISGINSYLRQGVDLLLYGPSQVLDQTLAEITSQLSDTPQFSQLTARLLQPVSRALQVQQTAILVEQAGKLIPIGMTHIEDAAPLDAEVFTAVPHLLLRQVQPEHTLFQQRNWVSLAVPLRAQNKIVGALLAGEKVPPEFFNAKEVAFVRQAASAAAIAIENACLFDALQEMSRDILRIQTAERLQLSARLHDDPLQQAAAIAYNLERVLTTKSVQLDPEVVDVIHGQRDEVRSLAKALRDICAGLRPPILDQGLSLTLREIVRTFRKKLPEVEIDFNVQGCSPPILSSQEMDAVYHIVSEALNNAGKHAQAKTLQVRLDCEPSEIQVTVLDDGCGILPNLSFPDLLRQHHFGIAGMYQWAEMVNGVLEIGPRLPRGTQVTLKLKVAA